MIFEPMCGTGRFLLPILQHGHKIEGSDASVHMLDMLKQKAQQMSLNVNVWKSKASEIPDQKRYSLIFIPSGSFGLITEMHKISKTLKSFYDHLEDNGMLVFEVETKHAIPEPGLWHSAQWVRSDGKIIRLSSYPSVDHNMYLAVSKYELMDKDVVLRTEVETYKIKIYEPQSLITILQNIGFSEVKMVKAFDRTQEPCHDDESVVFECRK